MFRLTRASKDEREKLLAAARQLPPSSPKVLTLTDGLVGALPSGFAHDFSRSQIDRGQSAFAAAREALRNWEQFNLGWVRIADPIPKVVPGELVAVEAHTGFLWSINFSRIVEIVDSPTRFGFMYTTTALHVEEGQERFVVEFELESGSVTYFIEAISRPRHILARAGYPFSRAMQHRFARDSHARMRLCVLEAANSRAGVGAGEDA